MILTNKKYGLFISCNFLIKEIFKHIEVERLVQRTLITSIGQLLTLLFFVLPSYACVHIYIYTHICINIHI